LMSFSNASDCTFTAIFSGLSSAVPTTLTALKTTNRSMISVSYHEYTI
jgi:hypothetical protein